MSETQPPAAILYAVLRTYHVSKLNAEYEGRRMPRDKTLMHIARGLGITDAAEQRAINYLAKKQARNIFRDLKIGRVKQIVR